MKSETSAAPVYESNPFQLIKPAFEAFKLCWSTVITLILSAIGAFVLLILLYAILNFGGASAVANVILFLLGLPIITYVISYISWAIIRSMLSAARGEKLSFKAALPPSWKDPLKLFVTELITGLLVIAGFLLLVIPGFFALAFWGFAPNVTVDTGEWGWAALVKSREIVRGRVWEMLGAFFARSCFAIVAVVPVIGTLAYLAFIVLTSPYMLVRYNTMLSLKTQSDWQAVPVSPWNYASLAIGVLVSALDNYNSFHNAQKSAAPVEINHKAY